VFSGELLGGPFSSLARRKSPSFPLTFPEYHRLSRGRTSSVALGVLVYLPFYASLFWLGSYLALRLKKPGSAVLLTLAAGVILPTVASVLLQPLVIRWIFRTLEGMSLPA
jgi:hypothetical protein